MLQRIKDWLMGLSFRTGVIVLVSCVVFYAISFAWFLAPISYAAKGILWAVFFGLAKTAQYSGLLILGPTLPAFFPEDVLKVLQEKFGIGTISTVEDDIKSMFE